METSILHIKAPHTTHIGAKVAALESGTSMNQYVVDLINKDLEARGHDQRSTEVGIKASRALRAKGVSKPTLKQATTAIKLADADDPNVCVHGRRDKCITCGWAPFKK